MWRENVSYRRKKKIDRLERKYEFMGLRKLFEVSLIIKDCHRDDKN